MKTAKKSSGSNSRVFFLGLILVLAVNAAIMLPAVRNQFTNWDDDRFVVNNPLIRHLTASRIKDIFTSFTVGTYVPLTVLSFAVEYSWARLNPHYYHLTNVLLHFLNCLLVGMFFRRLTDNWKIGLITGLLWSVNPLRVESVAWITERKDVLSSCFYLGSLLAYLSYRRGRKNLYAASLILFGFALLAKPMALSLPLIIVLVDYFQRRNMDRSAWLEKIPFAALSIAALVVNFAAQTSSPRMPFNLLQRFFVMGYNIFFYPYKTILPFRLSAFYPFPQPLRTVPPEFILPTLIALTGGWLLWRYGRRDRRVWFAGFWYLAALLPVSQVFPLSGLSVTADRYAYLPSLGLMYLIAAWVLEHWDQKSAARPAIKAGLILALVLITTFWSVLTIQRIRVWQNSQTLWRDVMAKYPRQPIALNNLGLYYLDQKEYTLAGSYFDRALSVKPDYADALNNRAIIKYMMKDYRSALDDCERALVLDSLFTDAYNTRGMINHAVGELNRAEIDFFHALRLNPNLPKTYNNLGNVYLAVGDYDKALQAYEHSLALDPGFAEVYYNRGGVYYQLEQYEAAIAEFDRALVINPRYAEAYYNRGSSYFCLGNYAAALADYERVLEVNPRLTSVYENRARVYYLLKDYRRAWEELQKALAAGYPADTGLVNLLRGHIQLQHP